MSNRTLTNTSYVVLGLLELTGESTPYELKAAAAASVGDFWKLQHAQLYTETERLAADGLLSERREAAGRRRKHYALTVAGQGALDDWRAKPTADFTELRDPGLLKLFFGADPEVLAKLQLPAHGAKLAEYEALMKSAGRAMPDGPRAALQAGIEHERAWVRFWRELGE